MKSSHSWGRTYAEIKADPELRAAYLERKRQERKGRPEYEAERKRKWRAANKGRYEAIRNANHAVEFAIRAGRLVRATACSHCGSTANIEAHHFMGYAPEHWLTVVWLCVTCHHAQHRHPNKGKGKH